jgi:hypothetical protein
LSAAIVVKLLVRGGRPPDHRRWLRQLPDGRPEWGRCRFVLDPDARRYDWLAVYDDLPAARGERFSLSEERLACPRAHTLLVTTEPSSVKVYGRAFLAQFGVVVSSQEPWAVPHPDLVHSQCGLVWFYGMSSDNALSYDAMKAAAMPAKPRTIATVCSKKRQRHTLHARRVRFTARLQRVLPELEVFGHGVRPIADKAEAVDPYRYHLAIENHVARHHWTEKLADPLLGFALPIYHGCPNAADYVPEDSFVAIDIGRFEESLERIRRAIRDDEHAGRLPAIREARRRVLDEHNLFAVLAREIERRHGTGDGAGRGERVLSRHALRRSSLTGAVRHGAERLMVATRRRLASFP